ncbi:MAG: tail fiber domain-containing protein [Hyphomicrobium sp.]
MRRVAFFLPDMHSLASALVTFLTLVSASISSATIQAATAFQSFGNSFTHLTLAIPDASYGAPQTAAAASPSNPSLSIPLPGMPLPAYATSSPTMNERAVATPESTNSHRVISLPNVKAVATPLTAREPLAEVALDRTDTLADRLTSIEAKLTAQISAIQNPPPFPQQVAAGGSSSGGYNAPLAASVRVDQLTNTTVTSPVITGGSITNATIGATSLSVAGASTLGSLAAGATTLGTTTIAGALTMSGVLTAGTLSVSGISSGGTVVAPYLNATDTAATSTFSGGILGVFAHLTSSLIDTLNATLANFGTVTATNATIANSTTTNAYTTNHAAAAARFGATATSSFAANGALTLATALTLPNGGTGLTALAAGAIPFGAGSSPLATSSALFWDNANGRLGIGTTAPAAPMQVQINADATTKQPLVSIGNALAGQNNDYVFSIDAAKQLHLNSGSAGNRLNFDSSAGANVFYINNTGQGYFASNVGIGTTSPGTTLAVQGSGLFTQGLTNYGTHTAANFVATSTNATTTLAGGITGPNNFVVQSSSGNVGIGTTTPAQTLTVAGPDTGFQLFLTNALGWAGGKSVGIAFGDTTGGSSLSVPFSSNAIWTTYFGIGFKTGATGHYALTSGVGGTDDVALGGNINPATLSGASMVVKSTGNVGIGTTTPTAQLSTTGTVRFSNFGAGTLTTDASGNLSVSSDERLKNIQGTFTRRLADVLKLNPIEYHWNATSGLDQTTLYAGFSAQNVQSAIPEAVGSSANGYLTLQDRPVIAAVVNAIKEIASVTGTFKTNLVAWLGSASNGVTDFFASRGHFNDELCVGTTCVTPAQFQVMVAASAASNSSGASSPPPAATSSAALALNGNNPAQWPLNSVWQDNLGSLFTHDGISETIYSTSTIDTSVSGTTTVQYWAQIPSSLEWLMVTRAVVISDAVSSSIPDTSGL